MDNPFITAYKNMQTTKYIKLKSCSVFVHKEQTPLDGTASNIHTIFLLEKNQAHISSSARIIKI